MNIEFDPDKDSVNINKHGISLSRAADMSITNVLEDARYAYGETRYRAWGTIDGVAYCLAFTMRGNKVRPISLRRAHKKEIARYG